MKEELNIGKISCVCITNNRIELLQNAINCFTEQVYNHKELLVFFDASDLATCKLALEAGYHLVTMQVSGSEKKIITNQNSPEITFIAIKGFNTLSLGEKRNFATTYSEADYFCVWDDDDWYSPDRLWQQALAISDTGLPACTLNQVYLHDKLNDKSYTTFVRPEGWEPTLLCKRSEAGKYASLPMGEDTPVLHDLFYRRKLCVLNAPHLYIYLVHSSNTCNADHFNNIMVHSQQMNHQGNEMVKKLCKPKYTYTTL